MKRTLTWFAPIWIALVISACTTFDPPTTPQAAIDQANVVLIAAATQVGDNLKAGIMLKSEAQAALDKVKQAAVMLDDAQKLLDQGKAIEAQDKVKLANSLLTALQREIAIKAREVK